MASDCPIYSTPYFLKLVSFNLAWTFLSLIGPGDPYFVILVLVLLSNIYCVCIGNSVPYIYRLVDIADYSLFDINSTSELEHFLEQKIAPLFNCLKFISLLQALQRGNSNYLAIH
jgi:hypothetical protein